MVRQSFAETLILPEQEQEIKKFVEHKTFSRGGKCLPVFWEMDALHGLPKIRQSIFLQNILRVIFVLKAAILQGVLHRFAESMVGKSFGQ